MLLPAAVSAVVIKHNPERGSDDLRGNDDGKNCDPSATQSGRIRYMTAHCEEEPTSLACSRNVIAAVIAIIPASISQLIIS